MHICIFACLHVCMFACLPNYAYMVEIQQVSWLLIHYRHLVEHFLNRFLAINSRPESRLPRADKINLPNLQNCYLCLGKPIVKLIIKKKTLNLLKILQLVKKKCFIEAKMLLLFYSYSWWRVAKLELNNTFLKIAKLCGSCDSFYAQNANKNCCMHFFNWEFFFSLLQWMTFVGIILIDSFCMNNCK